MKPSHWAAVVIAVLFILLISGLAVYRQSNNLTGSVASNHFSYCFESDRGDDPGASNATVVVVSPVPKDQIAQITNVTQGLISGGITAIDSNGNYQYLAYITEIDQGFLGSSPIPIEPYVSAPATFLAERKCNRTDPNRQKSDTIIHDTRIVIATNFTIRVFPDIPSVNPTAPTGTSLGFSINGTAHRIPSP